MPQANVEQIIAAAKDEIEAKGFEDACFEDIGIACGVDADFVRTYFATKEELCHGALFADLQRVCERASQAPPTDSILDDYMTFANRLFEYYEARPELTRTLMRKTMFAEGPWRDRLTEQVFGVHAALAAWADRAVADDRLKPRTDPNLLATTFLAFYYFTLIGWIQEAVPDPISIMRGLMENHLAGFAADR